MDNSITKFKKIVCAVFLNFLIINVYSVSLDEMIGQMLIIGFKGFEVQKNKNLQSDIKNKRIGGVILFDIDYQKFISEAKKQQISLLDFRKMLRNNKQKQSQVDKNIRNPTQLKKLNHDLQILSHKYMHLPLIIAVDREGGGSR